MKEQQISKHIKITNFTTFVEHRGALSVLELQDFIAPYSINSLKIYKPKQLLTLQLFNPVLILTIKGELSISAVNDSSSIKHEDKGDAYLKASQACFVKSGNNLQLNSSDGAIFVLASVSLSHKDNFHLDKSCNVLAKFDVSNDSCVDITPFLERTSFAVKRIFYVYQVPNADVVRGKHIHQSCNELLVAMSGHLDVIVGNDADKKDVVKLDSVTKGCFIPAGKWSAQTNFSDNAICLVLADEAYKDDKYLNSCP